MNDADAQKDIARLVEFGVKSRLMEPEDRIPVTNALLDLLKVSEPYEGELGETPADSASGILERLIDFAAERGIIEENTITRRDLLNARIMGHLMPRQSEVSRRFRQTAEESGIDRATDEFYRMSIDANYIRMDRIRRNPFWLASTLYGDIEITVNLSKPEKDPKEIATERSILQSHYPKCLLCAENIGYAGRLNHPARQNHRVIPITLDGEIWFFQYSPYVYYKEHCIIFSSKHTPMAISRRTFVRLLDFVGQFPHYFAGSNAELPIVGGSILSHDHYQGGRHKFPMEKAQVERNFRHPSYPDIRIGIVAWPMSVIRISSGDPGRLIALADDILEKWRCYSDPDVDIEAFTEAGNGERHIPHNTITPIARRNGSGEFELDLVLRNNRTTAEHPMGLFHPHAELHHIKKENIGLIEVMGLAVLPGRLEEELAAVQRMLTGEDSIGGAPLPDGRPMSKHGVWIDELMKRYGTRLSPEAADAAVKLEVAGKFLDILSDAGVFKRDRTGQNAFGRFMQSMEMMQV